MRGLLRHVVLALVASLALAAPAHAGSFGDSAASCEGRTVEQPFTALARPDALRARAERRSRGRRGRVDAHRRRQGRDRQRDLLRRRQDRHEVALPPFREARRPPGRHACSSCTRPFATSPRTAAPRSLSTLLVEALIENPLNGKVLTFPRRPHGWHELAPVASRARGRRLPLHPRRGREAGGGVPLQAGRARREVAGRRRLRRSVQEPLGGVAGTWLVAGVRWPFRDKDAGSVRRRRLRARLRTQLSGRTAQPGDTAEVSASPPRWVGGSEGLVAGFELASERADEDGARRSASSLGSSPSKQYTTSQ